jgi:uncharacterized protein
MAAKFELFKDKSGDFRFHLKAANGEIIASGQGYKTKAAGGEGYRVGQDERAWCHGGRQHRLARSASGQFSVFVPK